MCSRDGHRLAVHRCPTERGSPQGQPFDHLLEFGRHAASLTLIGACVKRQPVQALLAIRSHPALQSPQLDTVLTGKLGQRHAVLERRP